MGRVSKFTPEFRREALELVRSSGRAISLIELPAFHISQTCCRRSDGRPGLLIFSMPHLRDNQALPIRAWRAGSE